MTKTVKILIPIIIIVAILASVLLGVSLFLTPAEAATDTVVDVNSTSRIYCPASKFDAITLASGASELKGGFLCNDFYRFDISNVSQSGLFALTYYITSGGNSASNSALSAIPNSRVPYFTFKFCVLGFFSTQQVPSFCISGARDVYDDFTADIFNMVDFPFLLAVTYDTDLIVSQASQGYYTFYFKLPSTTSPSVNTLLISADFSLRYPSDGSEELSDAFYNGYSVLNNYSRFPSLCEVGSSYNLGVSDGNSGGHDTGYTEGYEAGNTVGYDTGYTEGYEAGNTAGYTEGYAAGEVNSENYTNGYNSGNEVGYASGYDVGYTEGLSSASSLDGTGLGALGGTISATTNMILKAFDTVGQINVFGITIWSLIGVAVAIAIIFFVVKLIKR